MDRQSDAREVIDAAAAGVLLGLAQRNTVSLYQRGYPSMRRPLSDLGQARYKVWLRGELEGWRSERPNEPDSA